MSKVDDLLKNGSIARSAGEGVRGAAPVRIEQSRSPRLEGISRPKNAAIIPLLKIVRDENQPRENFDEEALQRLAESIKARGVLQPILVRWNEGRGVYVVIAGERRWRASQIAGLEMIPTMVDDGTLGDDDLLAIQLIENALREDLKPIEQAKSYKKLMDSQGYSITELSKKIHVSQPAVTKALSLLSLPESVQVEIEQGSLSPSVAYEISKAPKDEQETIAREVKRGKLTRSDVEHTVRGPKKVAKSTEKVFRLDGAKLTIERKKGLDDAIILAILREAIAIVEG